VERIEPPRTPRFARKKRRRISHEDPSGMRAEKVKKEEIRTLIVANIR
jgi:hypothetical protein